MQIIETAAKPVKAWVDGVEFDENARKQVANMASLPFIHSHVAVMPDVHVGIGATVGSVIPTMAPSCPRLWASTLVAAMIAQRTSLRAEGLPDSLAAIRHEIERTIPVGFARHKHVPASVESAWSKLAEEYKSIVAKNPKIDTQGAPQQLATLGSGNHFCEVTIDTEGYVWFVLHSGSRGIGNRIGTFFIERARKEIEALGIGLPDGDLAYLTENTDSFNEYVEAVGWAQRYAQMNRDLMMMRLLDSLRHPKIGLPQFTLREKAVNCHHNYVARERHFGKDVLVTRKGAVRAGKGELGIKRSWRTGRGAKRIQIDRCGDGGPKRSR